MGVKQHLWQRIVRLFCVAGIVGLGFFSIVASGGSDGKSVSEDGTGTITIQNYDNKSYRVHLRKATDDTFVAAVNVDDFNTLDDGWYTSFEDVPEDRYYLVIFRQNDPDEEVDRSNSFNIDENDIDCYRINEDGRIKTC
jgi:hypothetical protein